MRATNPVEARVIAQIEPTAASLGYRIVRVRLSGNRRKRLQKDHEARLASLADAEASVPDLNAVMMVRVSGDVSPGDVDMGKRPA